MLSAKWQPFSSNLSGISDPTGLWYSVYNKKIYRDMICFSILVDIFSFTFSFT